MKTILSVLSLIALATVSLPATASTGGMEVTPSAYSILKATPMQMQVARRGADDPANHNAKDDKGGKRYAKKGGKGRGGHDDGPNHA